MVEGLFIILKWKKSLGILEIYIKEECFFRSFKEENRKVIYVV